MTIVINSDRYFDVTACLGQHMGQRTVWNDIITLNAYLLSMNIFLKIDTIFIRE